MACHQTQGNPPPTPSVDILFQCTTIAATNMINNVNKEVFAIVTLEVNVRDEYEDQNSDKDVKQLCFMRSRALYE